LCVGSKSRYYIQVSINLKIPHFQIVGYSLINIE
jgi:hypothetical protein